MPESLDCRLFLLPSAARKDTRLKEKHMASEAPQTETQDFSLGGTMDRIATQRLFSGHPADTGEGLGEGEGSGEGNGEGKEGNDQGHEAQPAGGEGKPVAAGEPPEKKEEPKFKHASWEETEKARLEAEQKMHTATQETARIREEAEALRKRLEEKEAKPPDKPVEVVPGPDAEARMEAALEELAGLDEDDPTYNKKAAKIWAKAGLGGIAKAPLPEDFDTLIDKAVEKRLQAEREVRTKADKDEQDRQNWERAVKKATDAGLDMSEGSDAFDLFVAKARKAPKEEGLDGQIDWAVKEVQRILGAKQESQEEINRRAKKNQTRNAVLERGGSGPTNTNTKPAPAASIGSILSQHMEGRRV